MLKKIILYIAALSIFCLFSSANVFADDNTLSQEKSDNIITNCDSIRDSLKKLQRTDSKTRVALGTSYQTIVNQYITPLNVRLVKNNRFDADLNDIQNNFAEARESFNRSFIIYSQQLESLLVADCHNNPQDFYNHLIATRNARKVVLDSTEKISNIINKHIEKVALLRTSFREK